MAGRLGAARGIVAVSLVSALLTVGCTATTSDSRPGAGGPQPSPSQGIEAAAQVATAPVSEPPPTKKKKKRNIISWILSLGPGAPIGPPEFTAYRELQQLHCATVFDRVGELQFPAVTLYKGAARACLAAFDGRSRMWRRAATAYERVAPLRAELSCMDVAAFGLLRRLVTRHERYPLRTFRRAPVTDSKAPPCPSLTGLQPDHGAAGTVVELSGTHLADRASGVDVVDSTGASQTVEVTVTDVGTLQVTMPEAPPPEESSMVCLVVRAEPDWVADGALFTYEGDGLGAPTTFDCPAPADN
jgi:hypothetical protein